jgi:hypothetical protein
MNGSIIRSREFRLVNQAGRLENSRAKQKKKVVATDESSCENPAR